MEVVKGEGHHGVDVDELEAEIAERWSDVGHKGHKRWLWPALDRETRQGLADVVGERKEPVCLEVKGVGEPVGMSRFYTAGWGADERNLDPEQPIIGKDNTQRIARNHLTGRTRIKRLARTTIGFSKKAQLHDIVIGLFVNRDEFGLAV